MASSRPASGQNLLLGDVPAVTFPGEQQELPGVQVGALGPVALVKCHLRLVALDERDLRQLVEEVRAETIDVVSRTGGHLGAGLGVVELTVALHYVFDTPRDRLIWDVGHQAYPHKILTGRRDRIRTLRTGGGLSGFTKRTESDYDPFGAAHSSTSISAALGMAVARDLSGGKNNVIAVIGDGAMSAGMAYEAMNKGEQFCGPVDVLGTAFDACYNPIKDKGGKVIGVSYIGHKK